jgi:hypothetical protein
VTLTRDPQATLTPATVPVLCEASFTDLQLQRGMVLNVSTFLAVGAPWFIVCVFVSCLAHAAAGIHGAQRVHVSRRQCALSAYVASAAQTAACMRVHRLPILAIPQKARRRCAFAFLAVGALKRSNARPCTHAPATGVTPPAAPTEPARAWLQATRRQH